MSRRGTTDRAAEPVRSLVLGARASLLEKKGRDPVVLDVRGLSDVTDYMIIVTGENIPHIRALCEEVERKLAEMGVAKHRRAGHEESGWVVLDYLDFMIHIFSRQLREYYALEELWNDARVIAAGEAVD